MKLSKNIFYSIFALSLCCIPNGIFAQTPPQNATVLIKQLQFQNELLKQEVKTSNKNEAKLKFEKLITHRLTKGSEGDDVKEIQTFLATKYSIPTDTLVTGYFGPLTESLIMRFQTDNELESVGIVGPMTRAAIIDQE